jgi:transposase, IS30 family
MGSKLEQRAREARFWALLGQGMSRPAACDAVGVHPRQGYRWFKAARGRNPFEHASRSGRYLSEEERLRIADLRLTGVGVRQIAAELGRAPSTISREITRNSSRSGAYRPYAAQQRCRERARRPKPRKLDRVELALQVELRLVRNWSPEQIRDDLARTFHDRPEMHVSHETIYQSLFVQGRGHLRAGLHKHLRTGRALRRHRGETRRSSWSKIRDMILISERPAEVDDRAVPGHWEGDLIVGIKARSAIGTLVERTTRYVILLHLPDGHSADAVRDAMIPTIQTLPGHLRRSLTWDQGTELARHKDITLATDLAIYFCDPHKPWQRGSNENTNGLLRQYFPKSTDLSVHSPERLLEVAAELNGRPRKTLDYRTPAEAFEQLCPGPPNAVRCHDPLGPAIGVRDAM